MQLAVITHYGFYLEVQVCGWNRVLWKNPLHSFLEAPREERSLLYHFFYLSNARRNFRVLAAQSFHRCARIRQLLSARSKCVNE